MGLYFVNLEKEAGWFQRFMIQHETSRNAEKRNHKPQTRSRPESRSEPSLYYVESGSATINIDGEIVAKLGTGHRYTGVLVPSGSSVQWNSATGANIRILIGEAQIGEVIAPGGKT